MISGCRFRREVTVTLPVGMDEQKEDVSSNEFNSNIVLNSNDGGDKDVTVEQNNVYLESVKLKSIDINLNDFVKQFLNVQTVEEAEQYKPIDYFGDYYEKDGITASYTSGFFISYEDENDGMAAAYSRLLDPFGYIQRTLGSSMRNIYPEEELESCTKEQAIKACEKYAKVCGYEDAEISSYAITLDAIDKIMKIQQTVIGAPAEGYEIITDGQIQKLRDEGKEKEATVLEQKAQKANERNLPWKKANEAILLVYRLKLNGVLVDHRDQLMRIVYVPHVNKIAILNAYVPREAEEILERNELISKEKAISQAIQSLGTNIEIKAITLIYTLEYNTDNSCYAVPAWRIDYKLENSDEFAAMGDSGTICIDAVSGFALGI